MLALWVCELVGRLCVIVARPSLGCPPCPTRLPRAQVKVQSAWPSCLSRDLPTYLPACQPTCPSVGLSTSMPSVCASALL